jgi:hypothetical protein
MSPAGSTRPRRNGCRVTIGCRGKLEMIISECKLRPLEFRTEGPRKKEVNLNLLILLLRNSYMKVKYCQILIIRLGVYTKRQRHQTQDGAHDPRRPHGKRRQKIRPGGLLAESKYPPARPLLSFLGQDLRCVLHSILHC